MRKIPTLFKRDPEDMKHLTDEVHPDCQWVLDGEGVATRKYDGTCVMLDENGRWWARREVKAGKAAPAYFGNVVRDKPSHRRRTQWSGECWMRGSRLSQGVRWFACSGPSLWRTRAVSAF